IQIGDRAQQTVYFNNTVVSPSTSYAYDSIYRLTQAIGREHISQNGPGKIPPPQYDPSDALRCNLISPSDGQAMQTYTESYAYDPVGNIQQMQHTTTSGGWTRRYAYATGSNGLLATSLPGDPDAGPYSARYTYDAHGNMTSMPHLQRMVWTFKNELQQVDLGGGGTAYYVYDASGHRLRKVWEHSGVLDERPYVGSYELYPKTNGGGTPQTERTSLHVMDDSRRICLVEMTAVDGGKKSSSVAIRYQLGNHLGSAALELDENAAILTYEEY